MTDWRKTKVELGLCRDCGRNPRTRTSQLCSECRRKETERAAFVAEAASASNQITSAPTATALGTTSGLAETNPSTQGQ